MEEKAEKKTQKQIKDQLRKKKSEEEIREMFKKVTPENSDNEEIEDKYVDDEFKCNINRKEATIKRKRNIEADTKLAETADRFKISNDAAAHLSNEVRAADQTISNENKTKVMSARKMERMRKRAQLQKKDKFKGFKVRGLMLDERINENKVEAGIGDKSHRRFKIRKQEDCAVMAILENISWAT